ncbi:hypothetical protein KZ810_16515 [Sphingomonas sp. RHCKR47]|uniref:hypothetical protein n=1 Tax=Sphingomonas citricola TaxID=2862498 RepID=UPI001CA512D5|nr:hypothetical protein [Sphingomonas citricola]MBW6525101.1 hypothetical protein [Sphingomonas citricola]
MQTIMQMTRLSQQLTRAPVQPLSRAIDVAVRLLFGASILGRARVARNVFSHHSGFGVIEVGCEIGVHVVFGGRVPESGAPYPETGVIVHAGARLIGPIRIGRGVVVEDVPAHALVAGVPGVIKRRNLETANYRSAANTSVCL